MSTHFFCDLGDAEMSKERSRAFAGGLMGLVGLEK